MTKYDRLLKAGLIKPDVPPHIVDSLTDEEVDNLIAIAKKLKDHPDAGGIFQGVIC